MTKKEEYELAQQGKLREILRHSSELGSSAETTREAEPDNIQQKIPSKRREKSYHFVK